MVPISYYLILSGLLFAIGTAGVFLRRNVITLLLSVEVMLNAVNLTFVAFGRQFGTVDGQIITFFVMTVAAAEAAVGLASSSLSSAIGNRSVPRRSRTSSGDAVLALIPLLPFLGFLVNASARPPPAQGASPAGWPAP